MNTPGDLNPPELPAPTRDEVRVVVVDDFPDAADTLAALLEFDGYTVRVCHHGEEALELIAAFEPHCVILDVDMPIVDGNQLSKALRTRYGDDIILIAITGSGKTDRRVAETFGRVDHYLQKPIDPLVLRKTLPPI